MGSRGLVFGATAFLLLIIPCGLTAQSITIVNVDGHYGPPPIDTVIAGVPLTFWLRYSNQTAHDLSIANGFEIYSPNGATWQTVVVRRSGSLPASNFDLGLLTNYFDLGDMDHDTVGIMGMRLQSSGLPAGYTGDPFGIAVGILTKANSNLTVCIDTAFYRTNGVWKWTGTGSETYYPSWGGPYCYNIYTVSCGPNFIDCPYLCCVGRRGNVSGDPVDDVDLTDLQNMIDYLFYSHPLPYVCAWEADVDLTGSFDIGDLMRMVDYMFFGGSLPDC